MNNIYNLITMNLEKVSLGVGLFFCAYLANILLGTWKNVKVEGYDFNIKLIAKSIAKFFILSVGVGILTIVVSIVPVYAKYIGITIDDEAIKMLDSLVIMTGFLTATFRYIKDAFDKLKIILESSNEVS